MEPDTATSLAGMNPESWVGLAKYVFDKLWPFIAVSIPSFLGGLAIKRPRMLRKAHAAE
jgi:hypothetical protein